MTIFLQRGDLLHLRYRIYKLLGSGGFGDVYYAYDTYRLREVALKISILPLHREGEVLRSLTPHNHIPLCYAYGHDTKVGLYYLVMEYIRGQTLHKVLQNVLSIEESYELSIQLITVLADVHASGIIFRDMKPSNILVTEKGWLYLIDFGIACRVWEHLPPHKRRMGTKGYLAPEVLKDQLISPAMDVYALGKVVQELLNQTVKDTACLPLQKACQKMLASSLSARPSNGREVFTTLKTFEGQTSLSSPLPELKQRVKALLMLNRE